MVVLRLTQCMCRYHIKLLAPLHRAGIHVCSLGGRRPSAAVGRYCMPEEAWALGATGLVMGPVSSWRQACKAGRRSPRGPLTRARLPRLPSRLLKLCTGEPTGPILQASKQ